MRAAEPPMRRDQEGRQTRRSSERGENIVQIALAMLALLAFLALVIDGGFAYAQRRRMQNAADAGAMAGARELALEGSDSEIYARIDEYTRVRNGATSFEATYVPGGEPIGAGTVPTDTIGVRVEAIATFPTFFASVIGIGEFTVRAQAATHYGPLGAGGNLLPMSLEWPGEGFVFEREYQLFGDKSGPGGFHWLDWNGSPVSSQELAENIRHPENSGRWEKGQLVPSGPGVQNAREVREALDTWLAKSEDQRHVTVIVYDYTEGSGSNLKYHIAGFAEFVITGYDFAGSNKWVKGKFVKNIEAGGVDPEGPDYGVYGVGLTE